MEEQNPLMFDDWLTNHIQTLEEIWEFYEDKYWDGRQPPLRQTIFLQTYEVIKYLRTVCEHARDVIQNAWSRKILNELYQFGGYNNYQKYLSAKNIVKLMRHGPFGYKGLKFWVDCATDETIHTLRKGFQKDETFPVLF
ncbi:hypothetical protein LOK49_LG01G04132 [Camellia lanceoleosa]|uniref:Uncharacterized protein n=1 Tax=Camellia lanceoleosa TaxID=1840588 RepID=A0ACC0IYK3_9ERIC|nr:hypothetical protein LOK49_LG01G04132 [Camellia lanceoleosa]